MKIHENNELLISTTFDELAIIAKCMIECVDGGLATNEDEYMTRFGYTKEQITTLLDEINKYFVAYSQK